MKIKISCALSPALAVFLISVASFGTAWAATGSTQTTNPSFAGVGALIMWWICGSRRKNEIGGWLLYYYIQLYIGVIFAVIITAVSYKNYLPSTEYDTFLYILFLTTTIPGTILFILQLLIAEKMRKGRSEYFLRVLKYVLWADLTLSAASTLVDMRYFPDDIFFDALALIWPSIWLPYFYLSKRVKGVFITKTWLVDHTESSKELEQKTAREALPEAPVCAE
jgi:hypothetical protein